MATKALMDIPTSPSALSRSHLPALACKVLLGHHHLRHVMMGIVALAIPWAVLGLDRDLGTAKKKNASSWREVFAFDNRNLNLLSAARLFLFASRDFWFEVPLPFYLRSPGCAGLGTQLCSIDSDCVRGAICGLEGVCENISVGGGCGGLGLGRTVVGAM